MNKKIFAFAAALLMTVSAFGCGNTGAGTDPDDEETVTSAEATEPTTEEEESTDENTDRDGSGIDLSFGMLGYVKKSKKSSANSAASSLYKASNTVLVDEEKKIAGDIVYSNTGEDNGFDQCIRKYFEPIDPLDYIIETDEYGQPKLILCSKAKKNDDYVGVFGDTKDIDELRDMRWQEVLDRYGFKYGAYTDIGLEDYDDSYQSTESSNYTGTVFPEWVNGNGDKIDYENMSDLDLLALSIGMEYIWGESDKPFYYYGKWGADEPFTAAVPWKVPEHGDIEFVIELQGFETGRVMCWEVGSDKSQVGKYNFKGDRQYLSDSSWDEILEYMGYTQGEYVEY